MTRITWPAGLGLICLGALLGAVTSYQVFDIRLTEGSGDLLGAALGAFLGVSFAAYLDGRRESTDRAALHQLTVDLLADLHVEALNTADAIAAYQRSDEGIAIVSAQMRQCREAHARVTDEMSVLKPLFERTAPDLLHWQRLNKQLQLIGNEVSGLDDHFRSQGYGWLPPQPNAVLGDALKVETSTLVAMAKRPAH